jgi:hypothetical protein
MSPLPPRSDRVLLATAVVDIVIQKECGTSFNAGKSWRDRYSGNGLASPVAFGQSDEPLHLPQILNWFGVEAKFGSKKGSVVLNRRRSEK